MSSPFITSANGFPGLCAPSSPRPSSRAASAYEEPRDPSLQQMKLKVLYTFDIHSKINCLARWPRVLNIRTAYLDESTQIGIVDLKTCVQAIVAASPELVATLGQDYTVYVYDYSEYDTPLVGQGMLSWVLASSSGTPSAPASQPRTFVTGRVCKSILGLFSGGPQETLEVKLRLVPVPTCLQSEYIESMNKYREISKILPEGFDAQAWTEFIQANPGMFSSTDQIGVGSLACGPVLKDIGIEHVQQLFRKGYASQGGHDQGQYSRRDSYGATSTNGDPFHAASPTISNHSNNTQSKRQPNSERAASRDSNRSTQQHIRSRRNSIDIGYVSNEERQNGPAKKRAKVTKAEWPTKGGFGKQVDSLRVVASTANSVRVLQPTAIRPQLNIANSIEEPPRVPTPTPETGNRPSRPPLYPARSNLGRASYSMNDTEYQSPYARPNANLKPASSTTTSPEDNRGISMSNTPAPGDIASSPPVFRDSTPSPSSPVLPALPRDYDSGFTSGSIDDFLDDDDEDRPLDDFDLEIAAQYDRRTDTEFIQSSIGEAQDYLISKASTNTQCTEGTPNIPTTLKSATETGKTRVLSRMGSTGTLQPSTLAASDSVRPVNLHRSQTWSGQSFQHPASDASVGSDGLVASKRVKSGSGVKRKVQLQSKLASTIAAGEMPPFCDNCGSIETPTWRKAWTKTHSGSSAGVQISKSEGGIVAIQNLEETDGIVSLFKIFKKSLLETDVGFTEILLCNPCGLWLHNRQCSRPRNLWKSRDQSDDNDKKGARGKAKKGKTTATVTQSAGFSCGTAPPANGSSPVEETGEDPRLSEGDELQLPPLKKQRAYSVQMTKASHSRSDGVHKPATTVSLQRATQSSPARPPGSQQTPIDLDSLTPNPIRRILFPSPKRHDGSTTLTENGANSDEVSHGTSSDRGQNTNDEHDNRDDRDDFDHNNADKENHPPNDDGLDDLFNEISEQEFRPSTPQPGLAAQSGLTNPLKTPTQQFTPRNFINSGDFFSSAAKAYLHGTATPTRTPSKISPLQQITLEEMTPISRHIKEFLSDGFTGSSPSKYIDFSSLPNLDENTSVRHYPGDNEFQFNGLISTDAAIPSSPPAWFGVYEDPSESTNFYCDTAEASGSNWMLNLNSSPVKQGLENSNAGVAED